jgi:putative sigma-54 modulation protein
MKFTYTGTPVELLPKERLRLEAKLGKAAKVIERKGERDAHIFLSKVRHLHKAEITLNAFDHTMIGVGSAGDLATALSAAIEKLETQILKLRTKWRDTHRQDSIKNTPTDEPVAPAEKAVTKKVAAKPAKAAKVAGTKVFRVNHQDGRKPMTLEEAMMEMRGSQDYLVYQDSKTNRVCTLVRRNDGNLDLIES